MHTYIFCIIALDVHKWIRLLELLNTIQYLLKSNILESSKSHYVVELRANNLLHTDLT